MFPNLDLDKNEENKEIKGGKRLRNLPISCELVSLGERERNLLLGIHSVLEIIPLIVFLGAERPGRMEISDVGMTRLEVERSGFMKGTQRKPINTPFTLGKDNNIHYPHMKGRPRLD